MQNPLRVIGRHIRAENRKEQCRCCFARLRLKYLLLSLHALLLVPLEYPLMHKCWIDGTIVTIQQRVIRWTTKCIIINVLIRRKSHRNRWVGLNLILRQVEIVMAGHLRHLYLMRSSRIIRVVILKAVTMSLRIPIVVGRQWS